jgi:hypothetical protein
MNTHSNRPGAVARVAAVALFATLLVGACSSSAAPAGYSGAAAASAAPAAAPAAGTTGEGQSQDTGNKSTSGYAANNGSPNQLTSSGPLIVRTGSVSLQVTDLAAALSRAEGIVTATGGYIAAGQRSGDGERATASVTYRIPVAAFETTLASLRAVGSKLLSEQVSSEEVTAQVVDLGARITNLRASEAALQKIMDQATKIADILEVQAQLTATREEIERLVAQQDNLTQQASLATLTVAFSLPPTVAVETVQQGWNPAGIVDRAVATMVGLGQGVAEAGIWLGIVILPVALVIGIPTLLIILVVRRRRRNRPAAPSAPTESGAALWPAD